MSNATTGVKVRARMYRQGLGDCFLLSFTEGEATRHVLIDCGVLLGTDDAAGKMAAVLADIHAETGGRLAALAVTHEHWDHVSGFIQAQEAFSRLQIEELWLPWVEDPSDAAGRRLVKERHDAVQALTDAATLAPEAPFAALLQFMGAAGPLAAAGQNTAAAMGWLKRSAPCGLRRYHRPGAQLQVPGIGGVRVYVLGPPTDPARLRRMKPGKDHETYEQPGGDGASLALAGTSLLDAATAFRLAVQRRTGKKPISSDDQDLWSRSIPFDPCQGAPLEGPAAQDLLGGNYHRAGEEWRRIDDDWLNAGAALALELDHVVNNTSLVLAFELVATGRVLLFAGDAQVGNWLSWDDLPGWQVTGSEGPQTVTAADLLARTVLYKVGHHGSHNATLRKLGLERMTSAELVAMLPVDRAMAESRNWTQMPFRPLVERLFDKTHGRVLDADPGAHRVAAAPDSAWAGTGLGMSQSALYLDCLIG